MRELIASALDPVIEAALRRGRTIPEQRANLLALTVCDPACGSGHFLLAAARRIGREVARLDAGDTEPDPEEIRAGVREAIGHCIYGVDHNALAVDLCKLALWLEGHMRGKPLGFLDHRIKHGNSLVGATRALVEAGAPDDAFEPVTGDDKKFAAAVKKRNKQEHLNHVLPLWFPPVDPATQAAYLEMLRASDDSLSIVAAKEQAYREHQGSRALLQDRLAFNLWAAAFFWPLKADEPEAPTHAYARQIATDPSMSEQVAAWAGNPNLNHPTFQTALRACQLADQHAFFHWELDFEDVYVRPDSGFDCILGNPPWERVKLQEQEFFAARDPEVAGAPNAAARGRAITALKEKDPPLYAAFEAAKRGSEAESLSLRKSGRFPLTGRGDVNTYSVFAELMARGVSARGRAGIIVPTGIATDDTNKGFFGWLVDSGRLAALLDFENREGLFPSVDSRMKFSLLTIAGDARPAAPFDVAFFLTQPEQLRDPERHFALSGADIALFNPNTRTCPIFRGRRDAAITRQLYKAAPVLIRENDPLGNPWGIKFLRMLDMSNDSGLFRTWDEMIDRGFALGAGAHFRKGGETFLPLYEAKLIHQFDHRFATYEHSAGEATTRDLTETEHANPACAALPRYWVPVGEVERTVGASRREHPGWFIGFRGIARSTDERSGIFSLIPWAGAGNSLPVLDFEQPSTSYACGFLANVSAFAFDFATRQKAGGANFNFFIVKQLPVLPPSTYTPELLDLIVPRVLELVYTAHDLAPFARDCGYDGPPFIWDEERRAGLRADLDGIYAHLYGLSRDDFAYVLDTFPIVARKDEARWGEYRTKRLCLEAYDRFASELGQAAVPERHVTVESFVSTAPPSRPNLVPTIATSIAAGAPMSAAAALGTQQTQVAPVVQPVTPATIVTGADRYRQAAVLAWAASGGRGDFNFGRLKLVKELYFLQEHLGVDLKFDFVREAAGPLDPAVYKVENLAVKQQWIQVFGKRGERASYQQGRQGRQALHIAQTALGKHAAEAEALHAFFRPFDTLKMEQWATVHQVWRDRSLREAPVTRDAIVADVLAWKPDKRGFERNAIERTLDEMEQAAMVCLQP